MTDEIKALAYGAICAGPEEDAARLCADIIRLGGRAALAGRLGEQTLVEFHGRGAVAVRDEVSPPQVLRMGYDSRLRRIAHPAESPDRKRPVFEGGDGQLILGPAEPRVLATIGPDGRLIPGEGVTVEATDDLPPGYVAPGPNGTWRYGAPAGDRKPTDDIKTQLERLVAGEWREREPGEWRWERLNDERAPAGLRWRIRIIEGMASLYDGFEGAVATGMCPPAVTYNPVAALSALCCNKKAVSILHGLDAFPEVDEPDPAWPWWWMRMEGAGAADILPVLVRWVPDGSRQVYPGPQFHRELEPARPGLWRRAPAPPGWKP